MSDKFQCFSLYGLEQELEYKKVKLTNLRKDRNNLGKSWTDSKIKSWQKQFDLEIDELKLEIDELKEAIELRKKENV